MFIKIVLLYVIVFAVKPVTAADDPFPPAFEKLALYEAMSWMEFMTMKENSVKISQMDGFLKVNKRKVVTGTVFQYFLYKSKEDYKYSRLRSAIVLHVIPKENFVGLSDELIANPMLLNGRYCIVAGKITRHELFDDAWVGLCRKVEVLVSPETK